MRRRAALGRVGGALRCRRLRAGRGSALAVRARARRDGALRADCPPGEDRPPHATAPHGSVRAALSDPRRLAARAGQLGRGRDHVLRQEVRGHGEPGHVRAERVLRPPGGPVRRLGEAREPLRRRDARPHAAPARARRAADDRALVRALPPAALGPLGGRRVGCLRGQPRVPCAGATSSRPSAAAPSQASATTCISPAG